MAGLISFFRQCVGKQDFVLAGLGVVKYQAPFLLTKGNGKRLQFSAPTTSVTVPFGLLSRIGAFPHTWS